MAHFNFVISQNAKWGHAGCFIDCHRMTSLLTCSWLISILWLCTGKYYFTKKHCWPAYLGLPASAFLATVHLPADVRLEASLVQLSLRERVVLAEHVHQVGDVAGGEAQRLDLGQLRVARNVRDAAAQRRERRVDAVRPPSLLAVRAHSLLHHASATCSDPTVNSRSKAMTHSSSSSSNFL